MDLVFNGGPFFGTLESIFWYQGFDKKSAGTVQLSSGLSGVTNFSVVVPSFATNGANVVEVAGRQATVSVSNSQAAPVVTLSTYRTTVNNTVQWAAFNFNPNSLMTVTWRRPGGSTIQLAVTSTDSTGGASGSFKVPATEGGDANSISFVTGAKSKVLFFDVAPRIKLIPGTGVRGGTVEVSLRGFTKGESVRIRWKIGSSFVLITTRTMSNTGSANFNITIPNNAPIGANSVRADGTVWRQQTNAFIVTS